MLAATKPDQLGHREWFDDDVIALRQWASDHAYEFPRNQIREWTLGAQASCDLQLLDTQGLTSRTHALLARDRDGWTVRDLESTNGLWLDDERRHAFPLTPGIEIGVGSVRLIAESEQLIALRSYVRRLLGWSDAKRQAVDEALRAIRFLATLRAPLGLCGDGDLTVIARELHDRTFAEQRPFIVCDPRRRRTIATTRSAESRSTAIEALDAARGGTMCIWAHHAPDDLTVARAKIAAGEARVRLVICYRSGAPPASTVGTAIDVPSLAIRPEDLDRIIEEYAADSIASLGAARTSFTPYEHEWLKRRQPGTISEIGRSLNRLISIRQHGSIAAAATHLGLSRVALSNWLRRRG
jgi:hypothetical protein